MKNSTFVFSLLFRLRYYILTAFLDAFTFFFVRVGKLGILFCPFVQICLNSLLKCHSLTSNPLGLSLPSGP